MKGATVRGSVLFVDDDPDVCAALVHHVLSALPEVRAFTASSPAEALVLVAREDLDVIVSDYRMPEGDGAEFLRAAAVRCPGSARYALASAPDQFLMERSAVDGFTVLTKPLDPTLLIVILRQALGLRNP
ncbi:MAG: response regulator [Thermoplasmatota archaeon]|nr:response regulator [Halobacteriales archaeon]